MSVDIVASVHSGLISVDSIEKREETNKILIFEVLVFCLFFLPSRHRVGRSVIWLLA